MNKTKRSISLPGPVGEQHVQNIVLEPHFTSESCVLFQFAMQQYSAIPSNFDFNQPKPQIVSSTGVSFVAPLSEKQNEPSELIGSTVLQEHTRLVSSPGSAMSTSDTVAAERKTDYTSGSVEECDSEMALNPSLKSPKKRKSTSVSKDSPKDSSNQGGNKSPSHKNAEMQNNQHELENSSHKHDQGDITGKQLPVLTDKKLRRLEKNRVSARECRRRKREAAESMVHEISALEAENVQLRLQLQIGQEAETSVNAEQLKLTSEIDTLLKSGEASEADIYSTLEEFKEKYADYGHSRRSSIEFHLRNIARLLMPTRTTSVVMHVFNSTPAATNVSSDTTNNICLSDASVTPATVVSKQTTPSLVSGLGVPGSASNLVESVGIGDITDRNSVIPTTENPTPTTVTQTTKNFSARSEQFELKKLFSFLVKYLEVTPEQAAALKDSRFVAQEMDSCLEEALKVLTELRDRLTKTGDDLEAEFNNVRAILSPTQAAKFLVWVANNAACMHMLNELWDRVYPCS